MITVNFDGQLPYHRTPGFVGPFPMFEVVLHWNQTSTPHVFALLDKLRYVDDAVEKAERLVARFKAGLHGQ